MQINKSNINKENIIETTLCLIEEKGGSKDVTLRDIAKKLGCAHTNLYNYFDSLDEIFWEALAKVLIIEMEYRKADLYNEENNEKKLFLCFEGLVEFSMKHTGWYKLVWLDTLKGEPIQRVNEILKAPGKKLTEMIIKAADYEISIEKAMNIAEMLHGYVHGELCKWINNRSFIGEEETKIKIISNLKYLYKLLNM